MKTGVSTTECGRVISATLALVVEHLASTRNAKAEPSPAPIVTLGVKVKRPDAQGLFADQNSGFGSCPSMLTISDQDELEHLGSNAFLLNFSCRCNKRYVKIRLTTEQNREAAHLKTSIN